MATTLSSDLPPAAAGGGEPLESRSTMALVRHLLDELAQLFRQEVRLATAEASDSLKALAYGATSVLIAAVLVFAGLLVLLAAAVLGLAAALPAWLAALAVGLGTLGLAGVVFVVGKSRVGDVAAKSARSVRSLARDKEVLTRRHK
jgi:sirohydrochlorin ferrochelatase